MNSIFLGAFGSINIGGDINLERDQANWLAIRDGANPMALNIYNEYLSATNYERAFIGWSADVFYFATEGGSGGGVARPVNFGSSSQGGGGQINFFTNNVVKWIIGTNGNLTPNLNNSYDVGAPTLGVRSVHVAGHYFYGGSGAVTSSDKYVKKVTGIADAVATAVLTVTIPNGNHAAALKITFLSSNGSTDAFESSRTAEGLIVLARTTGVATVAVAGALTSASIATVAAGATHTLAYAVSAISGAVGATQTFTVNVTIDDSGNVGSNQVVMLVELINAEASGVTIA